MAVAADAPAFSAGYAAGNRWPHRLAVVTAAATVLLILFGGLVTNTGSALAVPDWPTTFGYNMFLYPWSRMVGGVFYEHSHRLIGSAVGMLTLAFALSLWLTEPRRWVRWLGVAAVAAVVVQGVLGGLRVVLLEHGLAIIHGCFAQAFFALMVSLAVITSEAWRRADNVAAPSDAAGLRTLALIAAPIVYMQLVLGAWLTHTGSRLDAHLLGAALVVVSVAMLSARVLRQHAEHAALRRPALLLLGLVVLQLSLGLGAYLWRFTSASEVMSPGFGLAVLAVHRVTGSAVWGTAVALVLHVLRHVGLRQMDAKTVAAHGFAAPLGSNHGHGVPA